MKALKSHHVLRSTLPPASPPFPHISDLLNRRAGRQRSSKTDACRPDTASAPVTCRTTMQRLRRLQSRNIKAVRFLHAAEQAQRRPPETGHRTARPSPSDSTALHGTAAAAVAVMFCCLCVISTAAAQPGQCPAAWTTAALSVARGYLAATSLPEQGLAIFAGGYTTGLQFLY